MERISVKRGDNTVFAGDDGTDKDTLPLRSVCFSVPEFAVTAIPLDNPRLEQLFSELHPRLVASPKIPRLAVDTAVFDENMALLM